MTIVIDPAATGPASNGQGKPAMISIENATKAFGEVIAFERFDLDVRHEEALCLVGPSGCGKTTLLRCIDGLIPLSEGVVRVNGEVVTKPHPSVAFVFQHFGLFPWM